VRVKKRETIRRLRQHIQWLRAEAEAARDYMTDRDQQIRALQIQVLERLQVAGYCVGAMVRLQRERDAFRDKALVLEEVLQRWADACDAGMSYHERLTLGDDTRKALGRETRNEADKDADMGKSRHTRAALHAWIPVLEEQLAAAGHRESEGDANWRAHMAEVERDAALSDVATRDERIRVLEQLLRRWLAYPGTTFAYLRRVAEDTRTALAAQASKAADGGQPPVLTPPLADWRCGRCGVKLAGSQITDHECADLHCHKETPDDSAAPV
jgi:hypothetical protein